MQNSVPTILIIIGITGDLSKRMLLPAIDQLAQANELPKDFYLIGTTRQLDVNKKDLIKNVKGEILRINIAEEGDYKILADRLIAI